MKDEYCLYDTGYLANGNKENLILEYKKKGDNYEFLVYNPYIPYLPNWNFRSLMTRLQFINYLYSELYINNGERKSLQKNKTKNK